MRPSQRAQLPPGPSMPTAVQMVATWTRPAASLERLRSYGKRVTVRLPFQPPFVMLWDPAEIKEVFTAPPEVLHPGEGASILAPLVGHYSVILLDEQAHLEQRRLLLPAFHGERMQRLTGLMAELAEREVASWPCDEPVALHPRLQRVTLEIILRVVFGLDEGPTLDRLRDLLTGVLIYTESPLSALPAAQRLLSGRGPMGRFERDRAAVDAELYALIDERRRERAERDDILAVLLAAEHGDGTPMSDVEIRDELVTALVAGHETTA
ncbi:MAG: cytochrome P450, partial [Solirubrobacteraceae bacterium]